MNVFFIVGFFILGFIAMVTFVRIISQAEEGYQDEFGFHRLGRTRERVRVRSVAPRQALGNVSTEPMAHSN